jgi:hypothetical protein
MALAGRIRSIRPRAIFAPQGDQAGFSEPAAKTAARSQ